MAQKNRNTLVQTILVTVGIVFLMTELLEAKSITLRMATGAKPVQRFYKATEEWIKLVEERSNHAVQIKVFPSGQLYQYHELSDPLMNGDIDLGLGSPGTYASLAPCSTMDWIGWEMESEEAGWKAVKALSEHPEFLSIVNGRFEELGVKLLFYTPLSVIKGPLSANKPVRSIADFKGQLVYAPGANVAHNLKALGAKPVFVPTGEVYSALQLGTFKMLLNQQELYSAFKLYEQTKYMTDYVFSAGMMPFLISLKTWHKLPESVQKIMMTASRELQAEWFDGQSEFDNGIFSELKEKLEIVTLEPEEKNRWRKAMLEIHAEEASRNERTQKVWDLWNQIRDKQ